MPERRAWVAMRQRCYNKNCAQYPAYGGRGIRIHAAWRENFQAFLDHIGPRPSPRHCLRRLDDDGDYEPGNVMWGTRVEQGNSRRTNRRVAHDGRQLTMAELARLTGVNPQTLRTRLRRGWTVADAVGPSRRAS